jgi:hypothetical protein
LSWKDVDVSEEEEDELVADGSSWGKTMKVGKKKLKRNLVE